MSTAASGWIDSETATLRPLSGRSIIILGYGNQGRAQALNLRDSLRAGALTDVAVGVWARAGGPSAQQAERDGFELVDSAALGRGDLFLCLLPDEIQGTFIAETLAPALRAAGRPGRIGFAHGGALAYTGLGAELRRPPWVEVFLVAPSGPGVDVRETFIAGWGVPAVLAVWHDLEGGAYEDALAIATGIGAMRAGVWKTTVEAEAAVDLFGEQAVICGGLSALLRCAYETLTRRGYDPEMAYLECVHQLRLTAELIHRYGVAGMRERISATARFGDLTRGPKVASAGVARTMDDILTEIESGDFMREWQAEVRAGRPQIEAWRAEIQRDPLEAVGREVRARALPPGAHGGPSPAAPRAPREPGESR